jgi:hypothetical protein
MDTANDKHNGWVRRITGDPVVQLNQAAGDRGGNRREEKIVLLRFFNDNSKEGSVCRRPGIKEEPPEFILKGHMFAIDYLLSRKGYPPPIHLPLLLTSMF